MTVVRITVLCARPTGGAGQDVCHQVGKLRQRRAAHVQQLVVGTGHLVTVLDGVEVGDVALKGDMRLGRGHRYADESRDGTTSGASQTPN